MASETEAETAAHCDEVDPHEDVEASEAAGSATRTADIPPARSAGISGSSAGKRSDADVSRSSMVMAAEVTLRMEEE